MPTSILSAQLKQKSDFWLHEGVVASAYCHVCDNKLMQHQLQAGTI